LTRIHCSLSTLSVGVLLLWRCAGSSTKPGTHIIYTWNYDSLSASLCTATTVCRLSFGFLISSAIIFLVCVIITSSRRIHGISRPRSSTSSIQWAIHLLLSLLLLYYIIVVDYHIIFQFEIIAVSYARISRCNGITYLPLTSIESSTIHVQCLSFVELIAEPIVILLSFHSARP